MNRKLRPIVSILISSTCILALLQNPNIQMQNPNGVAADEISNSIRIVGLVDNPLNLSYDELLSFPMISEVATLRCVVGDPVVAFNWTGIPLFHLLTLAQIRSDAFKIVTRAPDGFESDLFIQDALKPTTILALRANGTNLPEIANSPPGLFRLVAPCKHGYKWVSNPHEIEVVDYDYRGTYESAGWSDEADVDPLLCKSLPTIVPPLQTFDLVFGNRTFDVEIFTNASIASLGFNHSQKEINMDVTLPAGATGFANFILPQSLLKGPYTVSLNNKSIDSVEVSINEVSQEFLFIALPEGPHDLKIAGTEFFGTVPTIIVDYNRTVNVGESAVFDASDSVDEGEIISYRWDFGDGTNGSGKTVSHLYTDVGTYQVTLNVIDNHGLSSLETLNINVIASEYIPLVMKAVLLAMAGLLALIFIILLLRRRTKA